jgi:hypothetical protein
MRDVTTFLRRTLDRPKLFAFLTSGAVWVAGTAWGLATGPALSLIAAAYVLVGSLALAASRGRTGRIPAVLWGFAVALVTALLVPVAGYLAIPVGLLFGTVCFGLWTGTGLLLLHTFGRERIAV